MEDNHKNPSKYDLEMRRLYTWLKHARKQLNAGGKESRLSMFKNLLALSEHY